MGTMQGHFFYQVEEDHCVPVSWCGAAGLLLLDGSPGGPTLPPDTFAAACRRRAASAPEERIAPEKPAGDDLSVCVCVCVSVCAAPCVRACEERPRYLHQLSYLSALEKALPQSRAMCMQHRWRKTNKTPHSPCVAAPPGAVRVNLQCGRAATACIREHTGLFRLSPPPPPRLPSHPSPLSSLLPALPSLPCLFLRNKGRWDNALRFSSSSHQLSSERLSADTRPRCARTGVV